MTKQCWKCPYTHMEKSIDLCCIGCDKPGIGSNMHDPSKNSCDDCSLVCFPCAIIADIILIIPMCLGYYELKEI